MAFAHIKLKCEVSKVDLTRLFGQLGVRNDRISRAVDDFLAAYCTEPEKLGIRSVVQCEECVLTVDSMQGMADAARDRDEYFKRLRAAQEGDGE